jgi:tRNA nucleotidyltransferase (CCA-adding enzyme)
MPSSAETLELARAVADAVRLSGGRALVVGGWVRDNLLGRTSKDIDLEVYGVPADRLRGLLERFGPVETIGESFRVYKLGDLDVSLPRRESKSGRGHRGFLVEGDPAMTVEAAARRRDFTINAIAWDPLSGAYLDPCDGRGDLDRRLLRAVDAATFADDSLRVLRAMQFVARFELEVEAATLDLCRAIPLDDLPAERIWAEFEKLLLLPDRPSPGFRFARDAGIVARLLPEMAALIGCEQEPDWHPEGDVWTHTLLVIDHARARVHDLPRAGRLAVMLGAVCHDFGKPATTAFIDGRIRSYNHEEAGVEPARALLDRLNVQTIDGADVRTQVFGLTAHHLKPGSWYKVRDQVGDGAFRRLAQKVDLELLARLAEADCLGRTGDFDCSAMTWFLGRARALGVEHEPPRPLLLGRHLLALGLSPGPRVGEILREVYERQLDGSIGSVEEGIAAARRILEAAPRIVSVTPSPGTSRTPRPRRFRR